MSVENPNTRDELIEHALMLLGQPVIQVNVTKEQCKLVVKQAISKFVEYNYASTEIVWIKYEIDQDFIDNKYLTVADDVVAVVDVLGIDNSSYGVFDRHSGFGHIFTETNRLTMGLNNKVDVYLYQREMSEMKNLFNPPERYRFNETSKKLQIDVDEHDLEIGNFIVYQAAVSLEALSGPFWNNNWLIKYSAALIKKQWGNNLSKFTEIALPGGNTISGSEIKSDAKEEITELLEELYENLSVSTVQIYG